jgi:hypothetical protein
MLRPGTACRRRCAALRKRGLGCLAAIGLVRGARAALAPHHLEAAEAYPDGDDAAPRYLHSSGRLGEQRHAQDGPYQRLEVQERSSDVGGHATLTEREQRCRHDGARNNKAERGEQRRRAARADRVVLGDQRDRQHGDSRTQQLQSGDRDRIPTAQHPGLRDGKGRRDQLRDQDQPVPGQT